MKSNFKIIAESIANGKFGEVKMPKVPAVRKLSLNEIKQIISEEFEAAKNASEVETEEEDWADAELVKQVDFLKKLNIKEAFEK